MIFRLCGVLATSSSSAHKTTSESITIALLKQLPLTAYRGYAVLFILPRYCKEKKTITMSGLSVLSCLFLALLTGAVGHRLVTTTRSPSGDERLMEEMRKVQETLSIIQTSLKSQCAVGDSKTSRLSELKEELLAMKLDLQATKTELRESKAMIELQATKLELQESRAMTELQATKKEIQEAKASFESMIQEATTEANATTGSTFIRWGKSNCTGYSRLLYSGVVGGTPHHDTGGAANRLCLSMRPVFDNTPVNALRGHLTGAEYYFIDRRWSDVVCALCHTRFSATFMVPGTNRCPNGAVVQYTGHLASNHYKNAGVGEFLCLDSHQEERQGSQERKGGAYIEPAVTVCGSLPCPPYVNEKVATCAVCSM